MLLQSSKNFIRTNGKINVIWTKTLKKLVFVRSVSHPTNSVYARNRNYCTQCGSSEVSIGRHMYHKDIENCINKQISYELQACLAYLSMACYFDRTDVALPGSYAFFMHMHHEEHEHALAFIKYQNTRGGHVKLNTTEVPKNQNYGSIHKALEDSLKLEKYVKEKLIDLHKLAKTHNDLHLQSYLADIFIYEQDRSICELARLINRLAFMGTTGTSIFLFDKELYKNFGKKGKDNLDIPNVYI